MFKQPSKRIAKSCILVSSSSVKSLLPSLPVHRRLVHDTKSPKHLDGLNAAQHEAVSFPPHTSLEILAGPGSGKTRVLTARVEELVKHHRIPPETILALTFTRKSAKEMQRRLVRDLGQAIADTIGIGTFHSICSRYLKLYGSYIGIPPDFSIWDEDECELLVWYIAKQYKPRIRREETNEISRKIAHAKGVMGNDARDVFLEMMFPESGQWLGDVYDDYHSIFGNAQALDFEDLQTKGLELFEKAPFIKKLASLQHVLVDEFQDTSSRQYLLVEKFFGATNGCVTVVGDPDQSIYGWRGADNTNFSKLTQDLPKTRELRLEENFRSTGAILAAAHAIIKQDKNRPEKSLYSAHEPAGPKPLLRSFSNTTEEASFIADEIKRLVENSDGVFGFGDIAILVRDNYPSEELKEAFAKSGIPFQVLPVRSQWDVPEVKTLLAYLRLMLDSKHVPMVCRALEGPHQVDAKAIAELVARVGNNNRASNEDRPNKDDRSIMDMLKDICNGVEPDTKPPIKAKGIHLIRVIQDMRMLADKGASAAQLLRFVREAIQYDKYLDEKGSKWADLHKKRVDSFIAFAERYATYNTSFPVRGFLELVSELSKANNIDVGKVSILTCHSAKGLEWPVVFTPEVVDGVHPHNRSENVDEERRLLYVGCTRAQCLLYMTLPKMKMTGRGANREPLKLYPSEFVERVSADLFSQSPPELSEENLQLFRGVLGDRRRTRVMKLVD